MKVEKRFSISGYPNSSLSSRTLGRGCEADQADARWPCQWQKFTKGSTACCTSGVLVCTIIYCVWWCSRCAVEARARWYILAEESLGGYAAAAPLSLQTTSNVEHNNTEVFLRQCWRRGHGTALCRGCFNGWKGYNSGHHLLRPSFCALLPLQIYILNTITTLRHFSVVATLFIKQDVVRERALHLLPADVATAAVV